MALEERKGIWYCRKTINGVPFGKSTKTGDKREAERIAAIWEAEAVREIVLQGTKPVTLHSVIKALLDVRAGTGSHANAEVHLRHFLKLPNIKMSEVTLQQLQGVINKRREAGVAHNTLAVTVSYWNALCKFAEERKWTTAIKLPRIQSVKTKLRFLSAAEEAVLFAAIDPNAQYKGKTARSDKARQDNSDLLLMLIHTGCRYREVARMQWSQVDLQTHRLTVYRVKGGVDNTLVVSDKLHAMLTRRASTATDEWVFPQQTQPQQQLPLAAQGPGSCRY